MRKQTLGLQGSGPASLARRKKGPPVTLISGVMEDMPRMMETEDVLQLRLLSLKLLRQLQAGQDAVQRSVAKTAPKSGLNSCNIYDSETPLSPETSSISWQASCSKDRCHKWDPLDTHGDDPCDVAWLDRVSPRVASQPPVKGQHLEPLGQPRFYSLTTIDSKEPAPLSGLCDRVPRSILAEQSEQSKSRVTCQEPATPESSWSLQPYLGYDWIVGVYCYRVNKRLFLVPLDPGIPCRLCGRPRNPQSPRTLVQSTRVRVSIPLSILDPPHQYRVHRRKSFDASDTLALPRHCLLGWDILPPKSETSTAPKSLDLWSSISEAQHQELSPSSSRLVGSRLCPSLGYPVRDRYLGANLGTRVPWGGRIGGARACPPPPTGTL
ncbi:migration and invasion-inhibitory protein isoform X3 [Ictidomys tridecemlineatus]